MSHWREPRRKKPEPDFSDNALTLRELIGLGAAFALMLTILAAAVLAVIFG